MTLHLRNSILAILLALCNTCSLHGQPAADPSLKLHFDFDEDFSAGRVLDVSGNGNDGWQFNPTNWITATNGVFGTVAAQFTYVGKLTNDPPRIYTFSQYIGVTNLQGFDFLTNGTISLWARFDSNTDNAIFLLDNGYDSRYVDPSVTSNSWTLGRGYANYLSFWIYPGSGGAQTLVRWPSDTIQPGGANPNYATASFHLYTITIDCPGNQAIAYYDGLPYQTNTIGVPWIRIYGCSAVRWLCVGASSHNGTPQWGDDRYPNAGYMVGRIDDLRIYNRTLSAAEVQPLYDNFVGQVAIQVTNSSSAAEVTWSTVSGLQYQPEWISALGTPWTPLGTPVLGDGNAHSVLDPILNRTNRFYRIRINP
jgi:hypothetical protein